MTEKPGNTKIGRSSFPINDDKLREARWVRKEDVYSRLLTIEARGVNSGNSYNVIFEEIDDYAKELSSTEQGENQ